MNKLIDINDVSTYPRELTVLFDNDGDINTDDILSDCDFKCCHVSNTYNIENYYKFGIMRPFIVYPDNQVEINTILKDIILKPIVHMKDYEDYSKAYDKRLQD